MTDAARLDLDPDGSRAGFRNLPLYQFKRRLCFWYLDDTHLDHFRLRQRIIDPFETALKDRLPAGPAPTNAMNAAPVQDLVHSPTAG